MKYGAFTIKEPNTIIRKGGKLGSSIWGILANWEVPRGGTQSPDTMVQPPLIVYKQMGVKRPIYLYDIWEPGCNWEIMEEHSFPNLCL